MCYLWLWIAFILPYLWDTTQLIAANAYEYVSCELLSFYRIFEIQHNFISSVNFGWVVVNCFHFTVSLRYNTTLLLKYLSKNLLWIAFILPYLWDTTQLTISTPFIKPRCELLSFYRIFEIQHNKFFIIIQCYVVVNCFHFTVSLRYNTTDRFSVQDNLRLWIAFILPYLWDTTQLWLDLMIMISGCELLSFYRIFEIQHNGNRSKAP